MTTESLNFRGVDSTSPRPATAKLFRFETKDLSKEPTLPSGFTSVDDMILSLQDAVAEYDLLARESMLELSDSLYPETLTLAKLRLAAGYSQRALAEAVDSTQSYIARLEKGEPNAGHKIMLKLCNALNVDMNTLSKALS
jgi:DNA-binding XRE family transcriptional regulator